jgi:hypothetical protein
MTKVSRAKGVRTLLAAVGGVVAAYSLSASSFGALLVNFMPTPVVAGPQDAPELVWTGANLTAGAGALGNADGNKPVTQQSPGGLQIQTPLRIDAAANGKVINDNNSTTFFDVTMVLSGLPAVGTVQALGGAVFQGIGTGEFQLLSTAQGGPSQVLLAGTIDDGLITGTGTAGNVISTHVTYTSGLIYDKLIASGLSAGGGSLSFNMIEITPPLPGGPGGTLTAFAADAGGLFGVVPEPATASVLVLGAAGLGMRRRRA